jgi:NAD-dependent deacetylase
MNNKFSNAASLIKAANHCIVYTGAGISKESGIPPFRGEDGIWNKYDPKYLELSYYYNNTPESWKLIKNIFFDFFDKAEPNKAHLVLADWENKGIVKSIITQNIDSLHQKAGSNEVVEFHGTNSSFVCMDCSAVYLTKELMLTDDVPVCKKCNGKLKPNFIFFGEAIPTDASTKSFAEAEKTDLVIIVGTTGEVYPAAYIPYQAKSNGAKIIEINPTPSAFTEKITDIFIPEKAGDVFEKLDNIIFEK